jgi:hypothetical protein
VAMSLSPSLVSVWSVPEVSEHPMSRMMFSTTRRQEKRCFVPGTLSGTLSVLFEPLEDGPHQEVPLLRPEDGAWVVELVAPEGFLWQRRHRVSSPAEYAERVPITRPYFEAEPETTVEAFEAAAAPHPVFRIGEALVPVCRAATVSGP